MFTNKTQGKSWQRTSTASSHASSGAGVRPPILLTNPKRKQMQLEESTRIYRENMHLLAKLRDVDFKRKKRERSFHLSSLNIKNRIDTEQRIFHENIHIIGRLQSQKSRYSSNDYRNPVVYNVSRKRITSGKSAMNVTQTRTFESFHRHYQSQQSADSPSKVAATQDGYNERLLLYTQLLTLHKQLYHFELSQSNSIFYVLLHELATDRSFKLRLIEQTGVHLISLIKNNRINFSNQLTKRRGVFVLSIPFHPFMRHFTFWPLQKKYANRVSTAPAEDDDRNRHERQEDSQEVLRREFQDSDQQDKWRHDSVDSERNSIEQPHRQSSELKSKTPQQNGSLDSKQYNWQVDQPSDRPGPYERLDAEPSQSISHPDIFEESKQSSRKDDDAA